MTVLFDWGGTICPASETPPGFDNKNDYARDIISGVLNMQRTAAFQADVPSNATAAAAIVIHLPHALLGQQPLDPSQQLQNTLKNFLFLHTGLKVISVGDGTFAMFFCKNDNWEKFHSIYEFLGSLRQFYVSLLRERA